MGMHNWIFLAFHPLQISLVHILTPCSFMKQTFYPSLKKATGHKGQLPLTLPYQGQRVSNLVLPVWESECHAETPPISQHSAVINILRHCCTELHWLSSFFLLCLCAWLLVLEPAKEHLVNCMSLTYDSWATEMNIQVKKKKNKQTWQVNLKVHLHQTNPSWETMVKYTG